ncbi:MAG TPA: ATPase, T2SS/T4P/T4SS family, partial [Kofleriaceae bacterium]
MFTIIIQEKGGEQRRMVFNKPEVTIGRVQGNDIVLPKGNVSKRHARIVLKDGKFIIVDLKSTNGTYVNGRKITSPLVVKDSDKIYIGDFIVGVDEAANAEGDGPSETTTSPPGPDRVNQMAADARPPRPTEAAPQPMPIPMGGPMGGGMGGGMSGGMGSGMGSPMGGGMGGMGDRMGGDRMGGDRMDRDAPPANAGPPSGGMPPPITRPPGGPPRPPGGMGPPREPPGAREPREPMGGPRDMGAREPREPLGGPRDMPPVAPPPSNLSRPPGVRPGGTMPPPMSAPMATPSAPPPAAMPDRDFPSSGPPGPPMAAPTPMAAPMNSTPAIAAAPSHSAQPAPVVPLQKDQRARPQPAPSKKVSRPVSPAAKRGVALEPLDPKAVKMLDLQSNILERLRAKLDLDKVPIERLHEEELWQKAERATIDLVETLETSGELPKYIDQDALIKETLNEALALGPLEDLFADEGIDEILIDRRDRVVVGKNGQLRGSGKAFSSDEVFERVVKRLVHEAGAVIDESRPVVDMRMRDGTRLTAAVAPVAARGACLVLKKPATATASLSDLVSQGTLSSGMADFLTTCINARRNILVCGGPGSGKTALVGALAAASPAGERVVSIEEVAELAISRDEWIQLE